jgi:hypothetical protein
LRQVVLYPPLSLDGDAEEQLVVVPTVAGRGGRPFGGDEQLQRFELVDVARTPSGLVLLHHRLLGGS